MKKTLIVIFSSLFALILVASITLFGYNQYVSIKEHHEQVARIKHQKAVIKKKDKEFNINASLFKDAAQRTTDSAKTIGEAYQSVWHDAIWDNSVDVNGITYWSFDTAVLAQQQSFEDNGDIGEMDGSYSAMNKYYDIADKNVTKNTQDKLSKLSTLKDSVTGLYNLASDTTGETLTNYTEDLSEAENTATVNLNY
jgi:hypothetical protein